MTERTVRSMAKELAGIFYEDNRSPAFRRCYPKFKDYMKGLQHKPNGEILIDKPGWTYHVVLARKMFGTMLGKSDAVVSPILKERIFAALVDENERGQASNARKLTQRTETHH